MAKARPENEFATVADTAKSFAELVKRGLGELPVQITVVPASTMRAIASAYGHKDDVSKPALMIELSQESEHRFPVALVSTDYLEGKKQPAVQ